MKQIIRFLFSVILISLFYTNLGFATHFMGSEMTWECVGKDSFIITLIVYRDCNGGDMYTAKIEFKCKSTGIPISSKTVSKPTPTDITPTCDKSCSRCDSRICTFPYGIQSFVYNTGIIDLSGAGSCCEILASYQSCCRSGSITIGLANKDFYTEAMLNRCITPCDNSPIFTNPPIMIICIGNDFISNHGVIDPDVDSTGELSDSLTYEWTDPLGNNGAKLNFTSPYKKDKPIFFWGFPNSNLPFPRGFHFDRYTGEIKFRPMKLETTVLAYAVKEYRNGVLIGSIMRDVQLTVINCPNNNPPVMSGPYYKEVFARDSVIFSIYTNDYETDDSLVISCKHNIPGASWLDNNGQTKRPEGTFSWLTSDNDVRREPYKFYVTVADDACPIIGIQSRIFEIIVRPYLYLNLGNDLEVCFGDSLNLSPLFHSLYNPLKYQWSTGSGDTFATNSLILTQDTSVSLTITDTKNQQYTDTINITVHNSPIVNLGKDRRKCNYKKIQLYPYYKLDRSTLGSVRWKDIQSGQMISSIIYADIYDSGFYECCITDNVGCRGYDTIEIKVNPEVKAIISDTNICIGDTAELEAGITGGGNAKYYWYKNNILEAVGRKANLMPTITTKYDLIASETIDSATCLDTASVEVIVHTLPAIELAELTERCVNDNEPIYLNSYVTPKGGVWSCNCSGILAPDKFFPSISGVGSHTIYYKYTESTTGCTNSDSGIITVHSLPDASLLIHGDTLSVLSGMWKYQWFKDGDSILGATSNLYVPAVNGSYHVTIIDYNGCQASSTQYILSGIKNRDLNNEISIYPNPSNGFFTIKLNRNSVIGEVRIKIISIVGKDIQSFSINPSNPQRVIDMRTQSKGIYILEITDNVGYRYLRKIIFN